MTLGAGGLKNSFIAWLLNNNTSKRRIPSGAGLDPQSKQAFCAGITVFRPADAFNPVIEQSFWPRLLSNRRDRLLTQTLNEVFGLDAESFQLLPNSQFVILFHDYSLPLDLQGDGTRAAMRTLMTLSMLTGTLMMFEEPECHQHPGSLERFAAPFAGWPSRNRYRSSFRRTAPSASGPS